MFLSSKTISIYSVSTVRLVLVYQIPSFLSVMCGLTNSLGTSGSVLLAIIEKRETKS